jgi:hypothetical protein
MHIYPANPRPTAPRAAAARVAAPGKASWPSKRKTARKPRAVSFPSLPGCYFFFGRYISVLVP